MLIDAVRDVGGKANDGKRKFGKYGVDNSKKGKSKSKHDKSKPNFSPSASRHFDGEFGYCMKWATELQRPVWRRTTE